MVVLNFSTSFFRVKAQQQAFFCLAQQQGAVGCLTTKKRKEKRVNSANN